MAALVCDSFHLVFACTWPRLARQARPHSSHCYRFARRARARSGAAPSWHICTTWFLNVVHRRVCRSGGAVDLERLCLTAVRPRSSLKAVVTLLTPAAGSSGVMTSPPSVTGSSPSSSSGSKSSALARAAPVCLTTKRAAPLSANPPPVFARQPPPLERVRAPRGILLQASPSRLAGDAMGSWTPSTLSAAAAAALAGRCWRW